MATPVVWLLGEQSFDRRAGRLDSRDGSLAGTGALRRIARPPAALLGTRSPRAIRRGRRQPRAGAELPAVLVGALLAGARGVASGWPHDPSRQSMNACAAPRSFTWTLRCRPIPGTTATRTSAFVTPLFADETQAIPEWHQWFAAPDKKRGSQFLVEYRARQLGPFPVSNTSSMPGLSHYSESGQGIWRRGEWVAAAGCITAGILDDGGAWASGRLAIIALASRRRDDRRPWNGLLLRRQTAARVAGIAPRAQRAMPGRRGRAAAPGSVPVGVASSASEPECRRQPGERGVLSAHAHCETNLPSAWRCSRIGDCGPLSAE